jgi:hypothetical protein
MRTLVGALLVLSTAAPAMAGQIYGTIFQNGQPVSSAAVLLRCNGDGDNGITDAEGAYRLFVRATGNCQLILDPQGRRVVADIYSYDRPTGYHFDLIHHNGRWELIRR